MVEQIIMRSEELPSNNFDYEHIEPASGKSFEEQVANCVDRLFDFIFPEGEVKYLITQQTFFLASASDQEFSDRVETIETKLSEKCGTLLPATAIVAQPPVSGNDIVLELKCIKAADNIKVHYKSHSGISYTILEQGDFRILHAAGLTGEAGDTILQYSEKAFNQAKEILNIEGMSFDHIVRQWNYIEQITCVKGVEDRFQNYQVFNDVRSTYYSEVSFDNGFPAATGIGMNAGGVIIGFIALSESDIVSINAIKNPGQIDAHSYSEEVLEGRASAGLEVKTTPKFERAKMVTIGDKRTMYVSGTASIIGEESVHVGDVEKQTDTTIENIFRLFSKENQEDLGLEFDLSDIIFSHLRVYVKHQKDIPAVRRICEKRLNSKSYLYLQSDVCREDLLVEIEGVFSV